jgi:hypothetical protein
MTLRFVPNSFTLDEQRQEINNLASDVNSIDTAFDERVDDRLSALLSGGTGISATYNDNSNSLSLSIDFTEFNTDNLTEGTSKLFFTQARSRESLSVTVAAASGGSNFSYDNSTGVLTYTPPALAAVATSGSYADLSGTPSLAAVATSGSYSDLSGTPTLATVATSGSYADLSGTPTLATVATSGSYSDLSGTPTLATVATSGSYSDLSGTPTLATVATSGSYSDLINIPSTFTADKLSNTAAPATASSTGIAGEIRYDSDYIYVCVATDTWKRASIATWT